ncbi:MAG: TIGR02147 family protein [Fibrobacterota bacterium]|nr:MAG: TIGR02147 family protein [Fibrobacterota bacterium]
MNKPKRQGSAKAAEEIPLSVSVFDYLDYHLYLKDWMATKRKERSGFSFQVLANRSGLKSRSFLRLVSIGEKDLLHATAMRLSNAMGHDARESAFFLAMVGYTNASDPLERSLYQAQLSEFRKPTSKKILSVQQYELFANWYINPVWELVATVPFGNDFERIAQLLDPPITADQARHAVDVLLDLEMIKPAGDRYVQTEGNLQTRDEISSKAIKKYQASTMELARRALDEIDVDLRQINTLTLGFDQERWGAFKELVRDFRQRAVDLTTAVPLVDRVYQVNIQAFPLTKVPAACKTESDANA